LLESDATLRQLLASRKALVDEWMRWREKCAARYKADRDARAKLRGGDSGPVYSDDEGEGEDGEGEDEEMVEEWVEEVIEEKEEVLAE
jgi:hypothetical protein